MIFFSVIILKEQVWISVKDILFLYALYASTEFSRACRTRFRIFQYKHVVIFLRDKKPLILKYIIYHISTYRFFSFINRSNFLSAHFLFVFNQG